MENYEPMMSFGADTAEEYDELCVRGDEADTVAFLAGLAGEGPVLELAVGTGRIALPLAATGLEVDGIELSPAMAERLQANAGALRIGLTMGDFADVDVPGTYPLIYVVFNTLFNLLTQDDQVRCFQNVARHLTDRGVFVVEAFVPSFLYRLTEDQFVDAESVGVDEVRLDVGHHDPLLQRLDESHVSLSARGVRVQPIVTRYAWPSELDLMARLAGLRLCQRWAGWNREPVHAGSDTLVSVYGR